MALNDDDKSLQDQQAERITEMYKFGWMDGYAEGYDDAVDDTVDQVNDLENENELLKDIIGQQNTIIDKLGSNAGSSLQELKKRP